MQKNSEELDPASRGQWSGATSQFFEVVRRAKRGARSHRYSSAESTCRPALGGKMQARVDSDNCLVDSSVEGFLLLELATCPWHSSPLGGGVKGVRKGT